MGEVKDVGRGRFSVVLDPLDGSSNVKSNIIFGTIFGIFDRKSLPAGGSDVFSAGYLICGPASTLVYAIVAGVNEFVREGGARSHEVLVIVDGLRLVAKGKWCGFG